MNYMYVPNTVTHTANTAILNLRIFSGRYHFRDQIMRFCLDWRILLVLALTSITQDVTKQMIPRPLRALYIILCFVLTNHQCILQIGSLNRGLQKSYWFSAVYYRIWLERYQIICVRSFTFAEDQQVFEVKPVNIQSRSPQRNICWYGTQKLPKTLTLIFITTKQKQLFS